MNKKIAKVILIFFLIFTILGIINTVNALGLDAVTKLPGLYTTTGSNDLGGQDGAIEIGNFIVSIVRYVGQGIAVITLIIIGIRYIFASVEQKAEYKKSMLPYVIGAILLFAGASVTDWIYEIFRDTATI